MRARACVLLCSGGGGTERALDKISDGSIKERAAFGRRETREFAAIRNIKQPAQKNIYIKKNCGCLFNTTSFVLRKLSRLYLFLKFFLFGCLQAKQVNTNPNKKFC